MNWEKLRSPAKATFKNPNVQSFWLVVEPRTFCYLPPCSEVSFFVLFRILWMLATVNKIKFSLRKTLITLVQSQSCLGVNLVTVYKAKFTSWKTLIAFTFSLLFARLLPPLLFSQTQMACHAFTHRKEH